MIAIKALKYQLETLFVWIDRLMDTVDQIHDK